MISDAFQEFPAYSGQRWNKRLATVSDAGLRSMRSVEQFHEELVREILRTERSNSPLILLRLHLEDSASPSRPPAPAMALLAETVVLCTRKCDVRGWQRDENGGMRIGVLLFNTRPEMVERIVEKLREEYNQKCSRKGQSEFSRLKIRHEVFSYPVESGAGESGGSVRSTAAATPGEGRPVETRARNPAEARIAQAGAQTWKPVSAEILLDSPMPKWKRALDVAGSGIGLAAISPLMLSIAALVKLSSPGPVFFRQERVGRSGRLFKCLKFRTMRVDFDQNIHRRHVEQLIQSCKTGKGSGLPMQKLDVGNNKITWIGRFLRPIHLDELPQLINVLRGEMSLVGPRPCIPYEAAQYQRWCHRRFDAMPGITGLWQVQGRNTISFDNMVRLDIAYARRQSLWLDIKILFLTIPTILHDMLAATKPNQPKGA